MNVKAFGGWLIGLAIALAVASAWSYNEARDSRVVYKAEKQFDMNIIEVLQSRQAQRWAGEEKARWEERGFMLIIAAAASGFFGVALRKSAK